MNALQLADWVERHWITATDTETAAMLRKQDAAIRQLREALDELMEWQVKNVKKWHNPAYDNAHKALAATEELK
jgi:hypothetical protein